MFKTILKKIDGDSQRKLLVVGNHGKGFFMLALEHSKSKAELVKIESKDGVDFSGVAKPISLVHKIQKVNVSKCDNFRLFCHGKETFLTYTKTDARGVKSYYAVSKDFTKWRVIGETSGLHSSAVFVPKISKKSLHSIYFGSERVRVATLDNQKKWKITEPFRVPSWHFFENAPFRIIGGYPAKDGVVIFYEAQVVADIFHDSSLRDEKVGEEWYLKIGMAIFDKHDPVQLLWQTELPLIELPLESGSKLSVISVVPIKSKHKVFFRFYTAMADGKIGFFEFDEDVVNDHINRKPTALLKSHKNPILRPTAHNWESEGAFNPAALHLDDKVYLLYRAVGNDGWSRIGYASSKDGINFSERLSKPIYTLHDQFNIDKSKSFDQGLFHSGGSWGGCEDPKMTRIDNRVYLTYVAHTGSWPTRTALTSISVSDFKAKRWRWVKPMLMSAPNVGSKSVVILPEKVNGNYIIFHRVWPNIVVDTVPELEFGANKRWLQSKHFIRPRKSFWDSQKLSMGAAPIKTPKGWLAIYNAVDRRDSSKYKIGAMLLDLLNPAKVIARSRKPILSPDLWYENDGKPGVAYPGGAVEINGLLHVYYGGADKVSCLATIKTADLVSDLLKDRMPEFKIKPISL